MKRIILLENLTIDNEQALKDIMDETQIAYQISLEDRCLIVHGDSDVLYHVKQLIQDEGFIIK